MGNTPKLLRNWLWSLTVTVVFAAVLFLRQLPGYAAVTEEPLSLYVIYDNSGSMKDNGSTAWKQVAYVMETMTVMMREGDKLTIYFMESGNEYYSTETFERNNQPGNSLEENKEKIHKKLNELNYTSNTYINGLDRALDDIAEARKTSNNIQLLILSDGEFNRRGPSRTSDKDIIDLSKRAAGITSCFFTIGDSQSHLVKNATRTIHASLQDLQERLVETVNLIYDREILDYDLHGQMLQINLKLPANRLLFWVQSDDTSQNDLSMPDVPQGMTTISIPYDGIIEEDSAGNQSGIFHSVMNIYRAGTGGAIAPGTYSFTVPADVKISVFAEYDAAYVIWLENADGDFWNLTGDKADAAFREGTYSAGVWFLDTVTGKYISDAEVLDGLQVNLKLDGREWTGRTIDGIWLSEGSHSVKGTVQLNEKYQKSFELDFQIRHQLGDVRLEVLPPSGGFDIDELETRQSAVQVQILEDGENISELADLELQVENALPYFYEVSKVSNGWALYPVLQSPSEENTDRICAGEYPLKVEVFGERDGQAISATAEATINYYMRTGKVKLPKVSAERADVLDLFMNPKVMVEFPTEEIGAEWITGIIFSDIETGGAAGVKAELRLASQDPLTLWLDFDMERPPITIYNLRNGGTITGNMEMIFNRFGMADTASGTFMIEIGELTWQSCLFLIVLLIFAFLILWNLLIKPLLGNRFWGTGMMVQCMTEYGNIQDVISVRVRKQRFKNLFRIFNPQVTISLKAIQYLGFASDIPHSLVIVRQFRGHCVVKNIEAFIQCDHVKRDGKQLKEIDKRFEATGGLEWELLGAERNTKIRINFER